MIVPHGALSWNRSGRDSRGLLYGAIRTVYNNFGPSAQTIGAIQFQLLPMRTSVKIILLILVLFGRESTVMSQPGAVPRGMFEMNQLPSSTPPPVISPPSLSSTQTVSQFRISTFKDFIHKASQPEYRFVDGQMYNLQPLSDFLLWVADLPVNPETTAMLKTKTRPLPDWSILYGRVAQVTDRNGILLWKYEKPEMAVNPSLVLLRNYPLEKTLVDGSIVVAFAKNAGPYSYIDSQRSKSTVNSYNFGKPVTKQEFDLYLQRRRDTAVRPLPPAIRLPTNVQPAQGKP